jgi:dTDP-4-dehydrorhamnose reductase
MSDSERSPYVLYTGAGGQLGGYLGTVLAKQGIPAVGTVSKDPVGKQVAMDITRASDMEKVFADVRPDIVIHGAAYTDVDGCERDPERADLVNHIGARNVAVAAKQVGAWLIAIGTDFVFSGRDGYPYAEDAPTDPISVYGASKLAGERAVLDTDPKFAVARTSWVFGGAGKHFPRTVLTMVRDRGGMSVVTDEASCPTFAGDLAEALVALLPHRPSGILQLMNEGSVDRFSFAREIVRAAGGDPKTITPTTTAEFLAKYPLPAKRPENSTMVNVRAKALGVVLPDWQDAVNRYVPQAAREMQFSTPSHPGPQRGED